PAVPVKSGRDTYVTGGKGRRRIESVGRESDARSTDVPIENSIPRTQDPIRRKTIGKPYARAEILVIRIGQASPPGELGPGKAQSAGAIAGARIRQRRIHIREAIEHIGKWRLQFPAHAKIHSELRAHFVVILEKR